MAKRRDAMTAAVALVAVLLVLALGFHRLGPRANQRAIRADERRIEDLRSIAQQIYFRNHRQTPMPTSLAEQMQSTGVSLNDPVTKVPYEYHPKAGSTYELCATFATNSNAQAGWIIQPPSAFWSHPKGTQCYQLDASQMPEY